MSSFFGNSFRPLIMEVGAARRRRERRLRQFLGHERLSVAVALSELKHHTSRGQRKDRAGGWYETHYTAMFRENPLPAGALQLVPRRARRPCLGEPRGPQEQIQQRSVEQRAESFPMVQMLCIPVPQLVDQLVEVLKRLDTAVVEQVIAVPKISPSRFVWFSVSGRWRNSCWKCLLSCLQQPCAQIVDVPVLCARGVSGYGSLHGSLPGQRSFPSAQQTVDIPVPGRGGSGRGGLQGFHPRHCSQRTAEQIVDIPFPGGRPQDFSPDLGSAAPSEVSRDTLGQGIFRTFLSSKKCGGRREFECEGSRALELILAGGL